MNLAPCCMSFVCHLTGIPNGDLVAVEARYHRKKACYLKYKKKLCALPSTDISSDNAKLICETVTKLMSEYYSQIIDDKHVILLTTLKNRFNELASESGIELTESCRFSTETFWRLVFSHEWFIIHLQRDEVELEINSEPRV